METGSEGALKNQAPVQDVECRPWGRWDYFRDRNRMRLIKAYVAMRRKGFVKTITMDDRTIKFVVTSFWRSDNWNRNSGKSSKTLPEATEFFT